METAAEKVSLLQANLAQVRQQVTVAAHKAGRAPEAVRLIAVSKTHPAEVLQAALAGGATDFGENRVQEAENKIALLGREAAHWHLIGHLQANKARKAVQLFDLIHSLDSVALALRLQRLCQEEKRAFLPVLIQVDLGGETTKTGVPEAGLADLIAAVNRCRSLQLLGFMTLPPYFADPEQARPYFRRLRLLRDDWQRRGFFGGRTGELSMGMSHDFTVAVEEGATMVRVGTAIFGTRSQ